MTTGGGGMVVTANAELADRIKHVSTQAKVPGLDYRHDCIGYNYRMPNINAALGLAQLADISRRLAAKQHIHATYSQIIAGSDAQLQPSLSASLGSAWMPCLRLPFASASVIESFSAAHIQTRPAWLPMHSQPPYTACTVRGDRLAEDLHATAICLPCSVDMTNDDLQRVGTVLSAVLERSCR